MTTHNAIVTPAGVVVATHRDAWLAWCAAGFAAWSDVQTAINAGWRCEVAAVTIIDAPKGDASAVADR